MATRHLQLSSKSLSRSEWVIYAARRTRRTRTAARQIPMSDTIGLPSVRLPPVSRLSARSSQLRPCATRRPRKTRERKLCSATAKGSELCPIAKKSVQSVALFHGSRRYAPQGHAPRRGALPPRSRSCVAESKCNVLAGRGAEVNRISATYATHSMLRGHR
jgi:hypothetical protein